MNSPLTPALLQAFFTMLDLRFQSAYTRRKQWWDTFADLYPSSTEFNTYSWLAEMPSMRKWVGEKVMNVLKARAYPLINDDFEHTYVVDRNKINDDQAGIYGRRAELQAEAAARWPEDLVTKALFAGTTALGYDGQFFFDTDHPVDIDDASLGTYSNKLTTATLTAATYAAAKAKMRTYRGESNLPLQVMPTVTMVHPANEKIAKEILNAQIITQAVKNVAATENVAAGSATNVWQGDTLLIVNERLIDDPDANADVTNPAQPWYMFSTDRIKPLVFQQREAPHQVNIVDPQNPMLFNQRTYAMSVEGRGAAGYALPFLAIKNIP